MFEHPWTSIFRDIVKAVVAAGVIFWFVNELEDRREDGDWVHGWEDPEGDGAWVFVVMFVRQGGEGGVDEG